MSPLCHRRLSLAGPVHVLQILQRFRIRAKQATKQPNNQTNNKQQTTNIANRPKIRLPNERSEPPGWAAAGALPSARRSASPPPIFRRRSCQSTVHFPQFFPISIPKLIVSHPPLTPILGLPTPFFFVFYNLKFVRVERIQTKTLILSLLRIPRTIFLPRFRDQLRCGVSIMFPLIVWL